jgi:hypothetical protein
MALPISPMSKPNFKIRVDILKDAFKKMHKQSVEIEEIRGTVTRYKDKGYTQIDYKRDSRLAWIIKKYFTNALGISDAAYYYLVYMKDWSNVWANEDFANIAKYKGQRGTMINFKVAKKMKDDKRLSALVLGRITEVEESEFYYALRNAVVDFHDRYGSRFKSPWHQDMLGLPREIFTTTDTFSGFSPA